MWCVLPNGSRLVIHDIVDLGVMHTDTNTQPGLLAYRKDHGELLFRAACGRVAAISSSTYAGGKTGKGNAKVEKMLRAQAKL